MTDAERDAAARERHAPTEEQIDAAAAMIYHWRYGSGWDTVRNTEWADPYRERARAVLDLLRAKDSSGGDAAG